MSALEAFNKRSAALELKREPLTYRSIMAMKKRWMIDRAPMVTSVIGQDGKERPVSGFYALNITADQAQEVYEVAGWIPMQEYLGVPPLFGEIKQMGTRLIGQIAQDIQPE